LQVAGVNTFCVPTMCTPLPSWTPTGSGVVVGALRARLLFDRVEQVFEHHAVALEADRVGVGQVVGDGLQLGPAPARRSC
jgi:hypothetical protein